MKKQTVIVSVFGQIEGVIADAMCAEQHIHRIEPDDIPVSVRYDKQDRKAHCALVLTHEQQRDFERRVRDLYR